MRPAQKPSKCRASARLHPGARTSLASERPLGGLAGDRRSRRGLLDPAEAADARAPLDVDLLEVLDLEPEVVLRLATHDEGPAERRLPAVQVAGELEVL